MAVGRDERQLAKLVGTRTQVGGRADADGDELLADPDLRRRRAADQRLQLRGDRGRIEPLLDRASGINAFRARAGTWLSR